MEIEIKISEQAMNNLMAFLDRVEIKGIKEVQAMTEILYLLQQRAENSDSSL